MFNIVNKGLVLNSYNRVLVYFNFYSIVDHLLCFLTFNNSLLTLRHRDSLSNFFRLIVSYS